MSFPLKHLLALYANHGFRAGEMRRGHGASAIVAFYVYLGIPEPTTADLTKNLLLSIQNHIRAELPKAAAESCVYDAQSFLAFIADGYTPHDWSHVLTPDLTQLSLVIPLRQGRA